MNTLSDVRVRNMVIAVLAVLTLFLLIQSIAAIAKIDKEGEMYPSNTISVRGTGEVMAIPDIATFTFTVREEAKDPTAAQQAAAAKINQATEYLEGMDVKEKDIKSVSYYAQPEYDYPSYNPMSGTPSSQVLRAYSVTQTTSVKVRDTAKAGEFLTGIANLKIGEVSGLSFTIDDTDALKLQAKEEAIKKAKDEAEKLADALGVDIEGIVSFYEEYPYEGYGGAENRGMMDIAMPEKADASIAPSLQPGEQKVVANVTITFEIED